MGRERKFGNQKRGGGASETESETNEGTSANEHADVLGAGLDAHTDKHEDRTHEDSLSSTHAIASVGSEGKGADTTDRLETGQRQYIVDLRNTYLDGVEDTEQRTLGMIEVILPQVQSLQTVHHTAIVSVGHGSDEGEELQDRQHWPHKIGKGPGSQ